TLAVGVTAIVVVSTMAVQRVQETAYRTKSVSQMRQIGRAMLNYQTVNGAFPPAVVQEPGAHPYSWRVALLPYIDGGAQLYQRYNKNDSWNSPNNLTVLNQMPDMYAHPMEPRSATTTHYQVFTGP